ncbi:hypothetical protein BH10BAC2_BH10BAC2_01250 [soil metagenome]
MIFSSIKNKALRITAWVFSSLLLLIVLLLIAVNIYIAFYKESLLNSVKQAIANNTSGKLEIKDINVSTISTFPNIAVNLEEVELIDSIYNTPLLKCGVLSCRINIFKIGDIQHQLSKVVVKDGFIRFYTDSAGYSNLSMFTNPKKEKKPGGQGFIIHAIQLENIDLLVNNEQKKKDFEFHVENLEAQLKQKDTLLQMNIDHKTLVKKMIFNHTKGSYLENNTVEGKMYLYFNSATKTLTCEKSDIEINDQKHTVSGLFRLGQDPYFHLDITSEKIHFEKSITALTPKLRKKLSALQLSEPLSVQVILDGPLGPEIPILSVKWQTKNNQLSSGPVTFDECNFIGSFSNNISDTLPHTDEFSVITMNTFIGKWHGLNLSGKDIKISNLDEPVIQFDLSSFASLSDIENAIGSEAVSFQEGTASVGLSYDGPLIADPEQLRNLIASFNIKNGKILYEPKNILLENCSGLMSIDENALLFKNFQFDFQKTHFTINVEGNEMSGLSKKTDRKAGLAFNINTPYLHLDEIFQVLAPSQKKTSKKRKSHFAATANKIDALFENSDWTINLSADKVSKSTFYGERLKVELKMQENNWNINHLSVYHAGGSIVATGQLYQRNAKTSAVKADIKLQQMNVQKLLAGFNNFGQNSVTANNLRGVLTADAHINMAISTNKGTIIPRSMTGVLNFSLKNGAIINHKGLEEMKILFLKNRDMSNVRFAELKDKIDIRPEYLYINKMEIQSTAVSMYLEGQYDIYGKNTDMLIQVPFSNFGERDETTLLKNKGVDAKTGLSIWISAKNNEYGEIKLTPRLSKKKFKKGK